VRQEKLMWFRWTIHPDQRLTTRSEPNAAHWEVTNVRSQRKGGGSAITQVKVLSPEIIIIAMGQGFHFLEASNAVHAKGECNATCRGPSPWQAVQRTTSELGRSLSLPTEASNKLKRQGGGMVIGKSDQLIVEV